MFPKLRHLIRVLDARKFVRFCLIGCLNTAIDYGLFFLLHDLAGVNAFVSQFIAQTAAILNSYFMNRKFTFKQEGYFKSSEFMRFVVISLVSLGIGEVGMIVFHGLFGMPALLSKLPTTVFTFSVNYLGNRFWVFPVKNDPAPPEKR